MLRLLSFDMDYHWACNRETANHVRYISLRAVESPDDSRPFRTLVGSANECATESLEPAPGRIL